MRVPKRPFVFQFRNEKWKTNYIYPNSHSLFNLKTKMKNELHVPKRPNVKIKKEKPIFAAARFFLQMQKPSSKTSFELNKFYLRITISLQILTLSSCVYWYHFLLHVQHGNHFHTQYIKQNLLNKFGFITPRIVKFHTIFLFLWMFWFFSWYRF